MASVLDLPQELLIEVAGFLPTADLASLSLTCRELTATTTIQLYHHIDLSWDGQRHTAPLIDLFLLTLFRRPELAKFVHTFACHRYGLLVHRYERRAHYTYWNGGRVPGKDLVSAKLAALSVRCARAWVEGFVRGEIDVMVALILLLTDNLKRLSLGSNFFAYNSSLNRALIDIVHPAGGVLGHCKLKTMEFGNFDEGGWLYQVDMDQIGLLLRLSHIQQFKLVVPNVKTNHDRLGFAVHVSTLTSLTIIMKPGLMESLKSILSNTPQLQVFALQIAVELIRKTRVDKRLLRWKDLCEAIEPLAAMLQTFRVCTVKYGWYSWLNIQEDDSISERQPHLLQSFDALRELEVPLRALRSWHNLTRKINTLFPRQLQCLVLSFDNMSRRNVVELLHSFLKTEVSAGSGLESIIILADTSWCYLDFKVINLAGLCTEASVRLLMLDPSGLVKIWADKDNYYIRNRQPYESDVSMAKALVLYWPLVRAQ